MTDKNELAEAEERYKLTSARKRQLCLLDIDPQEGFLTCQKYMRQDFVRMGLANEWRDHPRWGRHQGGYVITLSPEGQRVVDLLRPTWDYRSLLIARLSLEEARMLLTPEEFRFYDERRVRLQRSTRSVERLSRLFGPK